MKIMRLEKFARIRYIANFLALQSKLFACALVDTAIPEINAVSY